MGTFARALRLAGKPVAVVLLLAGGLVLLAGIGMLGQRLLAGTGPPLARGARLFATGAVAFGAGLAVFQRAAKPSNRLDIPSVRDLLP